MSKSPLVDILITELPNGVQYGLPPRNSGLVHFGIWPASIAVMLAPFILMGFDFWVKGQLNWPFYSSLGLWPLGLSLFVGRTFLEKGYCEIILQDGTLIMQEEFWPFHWTRRLELKEICDLRVRVVPIQHDRLHSIPEGMPRNLCYLEAECVGGKSCYLAVLYPAPLLMALAEQLNCQLNKARGTVVLSMPAVSMVMGESGPIREQFEKPLKSLIHLEACDGDVTFTIPPQDFWKANQKWKGFPIALGIFLVINGVSRGLAGNNPFMPWPLWLVFFIIVVLMYRNSQRAGVVALVGSSLLVLTIGLFRSRRFEWQIEQVNYIRAGSSNIKVNGKSLSELQIFLQDTKVGLLVGRDVEELEWIATVLRQRLQPVRRVLSEDREQDDQLLVRY